MDISNLLKILQEKAYLEAGGGRKSTGEEVGNLLGAIGTGIATPVNAFNAARKANLENVKAKLELSPIGQLSGVPTQEQEDAMRGIFENKQSTQVAPNLFPQPFNQLDQSQQTIPEPVREPFASPREKFKKDYGVSPDVPAFLAKDVKSILGGESLNVYQDSEGNTVTIPPSTPPPAGYSFLGKVPTKTGAGFIVGKEKAAISSGGIADRQQKTFKQQEKQQERGFANQEDAFFRMEKFRMDKEDRDAEKKRLTVVPSTQKEYTKLKSQIKASEDLRDAMQDAISKGYNVTGFLQALINRIKEIFGKMPKEEQEALTKLRLQFANFVRENGGTAFTNTERETYGPIMPEESKDEKTNLNRINTVLKVFNDRQGVYEKDNPGLTESYSPGGNKPRGGIEKYSSPLQIKEAVAKGKISKDKAREILKSQFPGQFQ